MHPARAFLAASSTVTGAGVATSHHSQISADKAKPPARNLQPESVPRTEVADHSKSQQNTPPEIDAIAIRPTSMMRCSALAAAAQCSHPPAKWFFVVAAHFRRQARNVINASPPVFCPRLDRRSADISNRRLGLGC